MAFNPFHTFRKHQKVIFALLTIVCMFVFILTGFGGKADPLTNLIGFFGGRSHQGDVVATLYGRDIYQSDLTRLSQTRTLVNQMYVAGPVVEAIKTAMDEMVKDQDARDKAREDKKDQPDSSPDDSPTVRFVLMQWKEWNDPQNPRQPSREEKSRMIADDLQQVARERETTKSEELRRKLDAVSAALRFQYWAMNPKPGETQRFYFGGSTRTEDLLDFEIWKHQADRLGIVLTRDDVRKEVAWDAAGRDVLPKGPWKNDAAFRPYVAQEGRVTPGPAEDDLLNAITDEYRVSIAQVLLMGHASGVRGVQAGEPPSPDPAAPFDFYSFYRNNRTTLKAAFLALPVEAFLDKVAGREPSEEDLERLYDKYKDQIPDPTRAAPAFKEPRRIEVQYVTAKPDSPFYKEKATRSEAERKLALLFAAPTGAEMGEAVDRQTAAQFVAASAAAPSLGGAAAWAGLAYGGPQTLGQEFLDRYNRDVQKTYSPGDPWVDPLTNRAPEWHDPVAGHPAEAAAVLGRLLGGSLTPAGALTASVATVADSGVSEADDRITRAAGAWLLGLGGGAALSGAAVPPPPVPAVVAAVLAVPSLPAPPPPTALADQVFREFAKDRAPELAFANLNKFIDELTKLKGRPAEAKEYVAKAVKEFGFELHSMERPQDVYELASDPNLKELRDAYTRPAMFNQGPKPDFIQELTAGGGVYDPKRLSSGGVVQANGSQSDQNAFFSWMLSPDDRYVFWRSVDERAHELSYDQARPDVVKAWRFQEARKLALAEANRIDAEARAQASPEEAVKYLREQKDGEVFELPGIARLVAPPVANVGVTHPYVRFAFPENKITYPPPDLLDRLMEPTKPGQTLIFKDLPQKEFYVAVLEERAVPGVKDKDFLDAFAEATQPQRNQLWHDFFMADWEGEYQTKLLRQLREEAGAIDPTTGRLVINNAKEERTPQGEPSPTPPPDNGPIDFGS